MFCSKCGKQIDDSSNRCLHCGAQFGAVQADSKKPKTVTAVIVISVVIVFAVIIGLVLSGNHSGLSGTWEYKAPYSGGYDYTIEMNSDGSCIIYEYGRVPYLATYNRNEDGTYITSSLFTSTIFGSWKIRKDGKDLFVSGSGLGDGHRFTKVS